jgi:uncharacterized protein YndB with AHSA1/START domain
MKELSTSIKIKASAEDIFKFITDPANTPKWVKVVVREEVSDWPAKVGAIYRNQDTDGNWLELEVLEFSPPTRLVMLNLSSKDTLIYDFSELESGSTELTYKVKFNKDSASKRFSVESINKILNDLRVAVE